MILIASASFLLVVVLVTVWWFLIRGNQSEQDGPSSIESSVLATSGTTSTSNTSTSVISAPTKDPAPFKVVESPTIAPDPYAEYSLLTFAFEHRLLGPGIAPDATTKMTKVVAAEDSYKLVRCSLANGFAVRWMNRYLTVETDGTLLWKERKDEPQSCWNIQPGYCGGDGAEYVMFQSLFNNRFLRVDGYTNKLVCMDTPSSQNAQQFCWKLQKSEPPARRCGTYFDPDYGRIITIPCEIKQDPPQGGTCADVTPGFMSKCCLKHNDASCRSVVLREVVGRKLNEASLYIKTRFPDHKIVTCKRGDACEKANPFPLYAADTWVLPYDEKLGTVHFPAFRFV